MTFRRAADALTTFRAACGVLLPFHPSLALLLVAVVTDWIDGPIARRQGASARGAQLDVAADSLLTLGAALAAVRRGAPAVVLLAPIAHYALAPARTADDVRWDRVTGVAQMGLLGAAVARLPIAWPSVLVTAARCAALLARQGRAVD